MFSQISKGCITFSPIFKNDPPPSDILTEHAKGELIMCGPMSSVFCVQGCTMICIKIKCAH